MKIGISAGLFVGFFMAFTQCSFAIRERREADCDNPLNVWFAVDVSVRINETEFKQWITAVEKISEGITDEHGSSYFGAYLVADADQKSYGPFEDISVLKGALDDYSDTYDGRSIAPLSPEQSIDSALSLAQSGPFNDAYGGLLFLLMAGDSDNPITADTAILSDEISSTANNLKSRSIEIIAIEKRPRGQSSLLDYTLNQVASELDGSLAVYQASVYHQNPILREIFDLFSVVFDLLCLAPAKPVVTSDNNNPVDGDEITLNCKSTTTQIHFYRWFFNGVEVSGQNSQTYTLSPATIPNDYGNYTCVAIFYNAASEPSDPLLVEIKPQRAQFTPNGSGRECETDSLIFTCTTASGGPITYTFLKDDTVIQSSASNTSTFSNISKTDVGRVFTCMAANDAGGDISNDSYTITEVVSTTIFTAPTGTFTSPNFDYNSIIFFSGLNPTIDINSLGLYPNNYMGCWRIEGNGQHVSTSFDFLLLEEVDESDPCKDRLVVHLGNTTNASGFNVCYPMISQSADLSIDHLFIVFVTDDHYRSFGFQITYTLYDP